MTSVTGIADIRLTNAIGMKISMPWCTMSATRFHRRCTAQGRSNLARLRITRIGLSDLRIVD